MNIKPPLRILLLDTGNEWGGGTNSMIELLKRIDRSRFSVTALFYRNYKKGHASDLRTELNTIDIPLEILPPLKQPLWAKLAKELTRGIFCCFPALRKKLVHRIDFAWRINPRAKQIAELIKAQGFDLLYMNNEPSSNLEGYLAAKIAKISAVQHCRIETRLTPYEVEVANRVAGRIICVSKGVMDTLIAGGIRSNLCQVIYNAIDGKQSLPMPIALPKNRKKRALIIGTIGSLIKRKANSHLLQAAARLKTTCELPFHLIFVGEGSEQNNLISQANALGLGNEVTFAGFQENPLNWVASMDIVVLASSREGLPRVILESMLLSKPVIASDIVGSTELVVHDKTGFLYPYGDIDALLACLKKLMENPELRNTFGEAAHTRALEKFSIDTYVQGVEATWSEIAA